MNLDAANYVPLLKWKRAEQSALRELTDARKDKIMPLVELVMPKPKSNPKDASPDQLHAESIQIFRDHKVKEFAKEIFIAWGKRPIFVDFTLLYPSDLKSLGIRTLMPDAARTGVRIIPVVNISDDKTYLDLVMQMAATYKSGVCVRLSPVNLKDKAAIGATNGLLTTMLKTYGLKPEDTYILADLKEVVRTDDYSDCARHSQEIVHLNAWKGFIFGNGSFPQDLSECKRDEDNVLVRQEWVNWKKQRDNSETKRIPTFADYAMRYPIYNDSFQFYHPTTSIKYTLNDSWLVMKGQQQKFEQYLASAYLLMNDGDKFYTAKHCAGDAYIALKGNHYPVYAKDHSVKGTGTTESWLKSGVNHHLSVVVDQLATRS